MKKFIIKLYAPINWDKVDKKVEYGLVGYVGINEYYDFIRVKREEKALLFKSFSEAVIAKTFICHLLKIIDSVLRKLEVDYSQTFN